MPNPSPTPAFTPRRPLGKTGFLATRLGIGDLADRRLPAEQLAATLRRALDAGLNVIDTAPSYEGGYSEEVVGLALKNFLTSKPREKIFVITKLDHHDEPAAPQLAASLARLQLPAVDAVVIHGLSTVAGWQSAIAPGGAFEQLAAERAAGRVKWLGISSHDPEVLRLAIPSGRCDLAMFAIGPFVDERYRTEILPLTRQHNVGTICFKTFGAGKLLGDTPGYNQPLEEEHLRARPRGKISSGGQTNSGDEANSTAPLLPHLTVPECLHYTLTCDPDVALLGLSFPNEQDAAFAAAQDFKQPLSPEQMTNLRQRAKIAVEHKGPCWWNPQPAAT